MRITPAVVKQYAPPPRQRVSTLSLLGGTHKGASCRLDAFAGHGLNGPESSSSSSRAGVPEVLTAQCVAGVSNTTHTPFSSPDASPFLHRHCEHQEQHPVHQQQPQGQQQQRDAELKRADDASLGADWVAQQQLTHRQEQEQAQRQQQQQQQPQRQERSEAEQAAVDARVAVWEAQQERLRAALAGQGPQVVVDCSFMAGSTRQEAASLAKQLAMAMAVNRKAPAPMGLHFTGITNEFQQWLQHIGADAWPVNMHAAATLELCDPQRVVVLSPDAEQPLQELRQDAVYCIGGLVDRTVRKNATLQFAEEYQLEVRRLPVQEHADQLGLVHGSCKRPILNINSVVEALLVFNQTGDWSAALNAAIPPRKRLPQNVVKPKKVRGSSARPQQPAAMRTSEDARSTATVAAR